MAELSIDIVANAQGVNTQLNQTKRGIDGVERELKQASGAAIQYGNSIQRAGRQTAGFSQFIFQSGQAVSDFAVAGVLGAANNIEFLTQQFVNMRRQAGGTKAFFTGLVGALAGPAGLIAAISAASAALLIFGDDIERALRPLNQRIKETKEGLEGLIKIADEGLVSSTTLRNLNEANDALRQQEAIVASLRAQVRESRESFLGVIRDSWIFGQEGSTVDICHYLAFNTILIG